MPTPKHDSLSPVRTIKIKSDTTAQQSQLLHIHRGANTQASKSASYQMALRTQDGDALGGMVYTRLSRTNYKVLKPACFNTATVLLLFENATNLRQYTANSGTQRIVVQLAAKTDLTRLLASNYKPILTQVFPFHFTQMRMEPTSFHGHTRPHQDVVGGHQRTMTHIGNNANTLRRLRRLKKCATGVSMTKRTYASHSAESPHTASNSDI